MVRGGSGRGGATRSAKDRGGAARNGRCEVRRRHCTGSAHASSRKQKGEGKMETALGDDKLELERRRGAMADAWHRRRVACRGTGAGGVTVEALENTVNV